MMLAASARAVAGVRVVARVVARAHAVARARVVVRVGVVVRVVARAFALVLLQFTPFLCSRPLDQSLH